jgi:hypothetical protein
MQYGRLVTGKFNDGKVLKTAAERRQQRLYVRFERHLPTDTTYKIVIHIRNFQPLI